MNERKYSEGDKFLMPQLPELHIEPCPFCGSECIFDVYNHGNGLEYLNCHYRVTCSNCGYESQHAGNQQDAIETHNELYHKIK